MDLDTMIRELNYTKQKHLNDFVGFGKTNISLMCGEIESKLLRIKESHEEAIKLCEKMVEVSEEYRPEFTKIIDIIKRGEN